MSEIKPWRDYVGKHEAYIIMCDALNDLCEKEAIKKTVYERLRQVQSECQWIPCSERLPEESEETYWVCTDDGYQCQCRWTSNHHALPHLRTSWHWHHLDKPQRSEVVAWRPLPEPYRKETNNG